MSKTGRMTPLNPRFATLAVFPGSGLHLLSRHQDPTLSTPPSLNFLVPKGPVINMTAHLVGQSLEAYYMQVAAPADLTCWVLTPRIRPDLQCRSEVLHASTSDITLL